MGGMLGCLKASESGITLTVRTNSKCCNKTVIVTDSEKIAEISKIIEKLN